MTSSVRLRLVLVRWGGGGDLLAEGMFYIHIIHVHGEYFHCFRREPQSLVKPPKTETEKSKEEYEEKLRKKTPVATRHLILIRHGQYVDTALTDEGRILTALGNGHFLSVFVACLFYGSFVY